MIHPFIETLNTRFGGVITKGSHEEDGEACVLEARNVCLGQGWSDSPGDFIDFRPFNDARWPDDQARTEYLVAVILAYWDWPEWTPERRQAIVSKLAVLTITRSIPGILRRVGLDANALECENANELKAAGDAASAASAAAYAADGAAAWDATDAAAYAAWVAAYAAASAAAYAAARAVARAAEASGTGGELESLKLSCQLWLQALE